MYIVFLKYVKNYYDNYKVVHNLSIWKFEKNLPMNKKIVIVYTHIYFVSILQPKTNWVMPMQAL